MIHVQNIYKSFNEKSVLKGVDLLFEPGKTNLIIGSSGSGKTTIAKCMVGLIKPDRGQIKYNGVDFLNLGFLETNEIRKQIGFLFQGSALFDSLSVEENIMFPLQMLTSMNKKDILHRVKLCLERVNLEGTEKLFPSDLSGGMKKRVGIARAIANNPKYLFCDEPNSGLDPHTSVVIDELIQEITKEYKMTTIVITHDMNSVISIGEKIFFLHDGEKKWEGSSKTVLNSNCKELNDFIFASAFLKEIKAFKDQTILKQ